LSTILVGAQWQAWRAHFGESAGSGSIASANATVPEPATMVVLIVTVAGVLTRRRWSTCRVSNTQQRMTFVNKSPS